MTLDQQKEQLRRQILAQRRGLTAEYRRQADGIIQQKVLASAEYQAAGVIFIYVSVAGEPETRGIISRAFAAGKTVLVPRVLPGGKMAAVRIESLDQLAPGFSGIPEPREETDWGQAVDLAVVPCVSATADGVRLGHGGGYYDRYLAGHPCSSLALCYGELMRDQLPYGENDVKVDRVVSDR
jgi:5-formyltetrahydrofolate cyclo-ligase